MNPRLPKLGHSRPQKDSSVFDRLNATKPSSVATDSCARSLRRRGIAAICRMATSSLSLPSQPSDREIRQVNQVREAVRCDAAHVPEQIEFEDAFKAGQAGESIVAERPVDEQVALAVPLSPICGISSA